MGCSHCIDGVSSCRTSPVWWHKLVVLALQERRQEEHKLEASLSYKVSSRLAWASHSENLTQAKQNKAIKTKPKMEYKVPELRSERDKESEPMDFEFSLRNFLGLS